MFLSFHEVDTLFYSFLFGSLEPAEDGNNYLSVTNHKGETKNVLWRYFKKSAQDFAEGEDEIYPVISVENFTPVENMKFSAEFVNNAEMRYEQIYNEEETETDPDNITEVGKEVPFDFKYELTISAKSESDWDALKQNLLAKFSFGTDKVLIFDPENEENAEKTVYYTLAQQDSPTIDGVYESIIAVVLTAWVKIKTDKTIDRCHGVNINMTIVSHL